MLVILLDHDSSTAVNQRDPGNILPQNSSKGFDTVHLRRGEVPRGSFPSGLILAETKASPATTKRSLWRWCWVCVFHTCSECDPKHLNLDAFPFFLQCTVCSLYRSGCTIIPPLRKLCRRDVSWPTGVTLTHDGQAFALRVGFFAVPIDQSGGIVAESLVSISTSEQQVC